NIATVYEEPPRSGPYMGVYPGLQYFAQQFGPATVAEGVLLLGADMPRIAQGLTQLFDHHDAATHAGVAIAQAAGRLQPLLSYVPRPLAEQVFAKPVINAGLMKTLRTCEHRVLDVPRSEERRVGRAGTSGTVRLCQ